MNRPLRAFIDANVFVATRTLDVLLRSPIAEQSSPFGPRWCSMRRERLSVGSMEREEIRVISRQRNVHFRMLWRCRKWVILIVWSFQTEMTATWLPLHLRQLRCYCDI